MKKMKKLIMLFVVMAFAICGLTGCKYRSSYSATMCVKSNNQDSAFLTFYTFKGTQVFDLNNQKDKAVGIKYSGKLKEGSLTVYYDADDSKKELFSIKGGEELNSTADIVVEDMSYIIIETDGKCVEGDFEFELVYEK